MSFAESYLGVLRAAVGTRPLISVGARVLIEDDAGRVLILRRADDRLWGLPGGSMELGESLMDAARREAFEETGLRLGDVWAFGLSSDPVAERHVYPNGDEVQSVALLTHARLPEGQSPGAMDGEALEFRFVDPAGVAADSFVAPEFPVLRYWLRYRESGVFQLV